MRVYLFYWQEDIYDEIGSGTTLVAANSPRHAKSIIKELADDNWKFDKCLKDVFYNGSKNGHIIYSSYY